MPVLFRAQERTLTACLTGEIDHHGAKEIMLALGDELDAALPTRLVVDMSGVTFMDSSGIAVLLRAFRRVEEIGGSMEVTAVPRQAARVLRTAGLERLIPIETCG